LIKARSKSKDAQFISELSEDNHAFKKRKKKKGTIQMSSRLNHRQLLNIQMMMMMIVQL
jgi:hypothetical protein